MPASLKNMFRALTVRNYRLYFMGQGVSVIGTWIQRTTMGWFVYRLTGSVFMLGLVSFLSMIPSVFISPFAGTWADKWNRHKLIIGTQTAFFIQTSLLATGALTGFINADRLWPIVALSLFQGVIEGIDAPVRQSFLIDLVKIRSMIPNAVAMNSAMFNGARLVGPAVAGFLIVAVGEGFCFAINAISYIAVIVMLIMMNITYTPYVDTGESTFKKIKDGWRYSWGQFPIRFLISNIAIYTLFGMSYTTLLPVFAKDILHGDSRTMGMMMSFAGIGALIGALYLASRTTIENMANRMLLLGILVSVTLIGLSFSTLLPLSLFLMVIIGFGMMMQMSSTNTLIQSVVEDKMRGRVLSLYTMAFGSVTPFGSILTGTLSSRIGVQYTLAICAAVCLIWSLSGLRTLPKMNRSIFRMLIHANNREIYRPRDISISMKPEQISESI
ncbi:MAG TPA: MFS transporter [Candidatus Cloacimonadota bacterium]|nr:MFS transporter [Candidatus Cloacimonadota bacterium]